MPLFMLTYFFLCLPVLQNLRSQHPTVLDCTVFSPTRPTVESSTPVGTEKDPSTSVLLALHMTITREFVFGLTSWTLVTSSVSKVPFDEESERVKVSQ